MTAERWWVRLAARWLARLKGVEGQLRLAMLGLTGISTATLTLQQYGHGQYAWPLIVTITTGTVIYTYFYTEGGVWNQAARDQTDLSTNFSGPTMLIEKQIQAAQFAYLVSETSDKTYEEAYQELQSLSADQWTEYRDGITLNE